MLEISPIVIAAILLTQFVIAQHIGLRSLRSLRETFGVGTTIICTLPIAAILDWILLHAVLQPFAIVFLRLFVGVMLTAAIAAFIEALLRARFPRWFPPVGNLLPLAMTTCCTLIVVQIIGIPAASFFQTLFGAIGLSLGAVFLLIVLESLRKRATEKPKLLFNIVADDILHAVFILVALRGVLSIWQ